MMEKMGKILTARIFAIVILALACVGMWGCGLFDEEVTTAVDDVRTGGTMVAIIDDSLALMQNARAWHEHAESCDYWDNCDRGTMNQGLFLVNYREKKDPYWGDTIEGRISLVVGFYHDSSTMFSNGNDEFGFWKIGEKPRVVRKWNCQAPCECDQPKYGRPWMGGRALLKMSGDCPYAILDTMTGNVRKLEFTGEYAWLEGCDDITYIDGDVVCLRQRGDRLCEIDFEKRDGIVDSLIKGEWMLFDPPEFFGNAVKMKASSFDKNDHAYDFGDRLALIEKNGFDFESYPETWLKNNSFVDSTGSSISYSSEDLIVTK